MAYNNSAKMENKIVVLKSHTCGCKIPGINKICDTNFYLHVLLYSCMSQ